MDDTQLTEFGAAPAPRVPGLDDALEHVVRRGPRDSSATAAAFYPGTRRETRLRREQTAQLARDETVAMGTPSEAACARGAAAAVSPLCPDRRRSCAFPTPPSENASVS